MYKKVNPSGANPDVAAANLLTFIFGLEVMSEEDYRALQAFIVTQSFHSDAVLQFMTAIREGEG
jgi:ABC-type uncharacterized transport system permease subunit